MAYKLLRGGCVLRLLDNTSIPPDDRNADWQEYQAWLAKGNTPAPAMTPEEIAAEEAFTQAANYVKWAREQAILDGLPSWQQVESAIDNATLADMKTIIKKLAKVVYILAKNEAP